jgi:1-acyl-sn-glycerol-3-phosphate acyltransferase
MWQKTKELQRDYFKDAAAHMEDSAYIHDATQKVLNDIAVATNTQIVSGKENISDIKTPALVVLNHYSGYKLTSLKSDDLEIDFGKMEELYPFPSFFASMIPVARGIGQDVTLHDAHLEYGRKEDDSLLRKIQEKAGLLVISEENGGFKDTLDATRQIIDKNPKSLIVVFPEGESSGKRNEGGPYDMVAFHTGAFVIAGELGLPVIPAVQYFNPDTGFQVVVLPPIESRVFEKGPDGKPTAESKEYYEKLAQETHDKMQYELDRLMGKVA